MLTIGHTHLYRAVMGCLGLIVFCVLAISASSADTNAPRQSEVFTAGEEGYHTFRIPSLLVTPKGTTLAFCEGRKRGTSDTGNIDLLLKRSRDNGETWQPLQVIADDGSNTFGNPCPVVDQSSGTIWLPLTHNLGEDSEDEILNQAGKSTRTVWMLHSRDEGATWSKPVEITSSVKPTNWTWFATGPGVGIQLRSGRLLIPSDHYLAGSKARYSHAMFSDDHGATWKVGATIGPNCNECQAIELGDGTVMMNIRSYHGKNRRAVAYSKDGGQTWSDPVLDEALIDPVCQASIIRHATGQGTNVVLFSNAASTRREKMTVRMSYDEGKTWPVSKLLHNGPAAYSCLSILPDGQVGCLYERGDKRIYEKITLARFPLKWLQEP